ncbi:DEAD/DEAH box helicase [Halonotius sp. F2-221B]|uniref:DEAD/DEAH box helicase n=1 Tax=Halonotius sp. F2-221B TaxID=2731620 RepID=UPI00398B0C26
MSTYNPIELGEHAQESYAKYLIGNNQRGYQGLLNDFSHDDDTTAEQAFIRSKGPYIQGVPAAQWSDTSWRTFAETVDGEFAPGGLEDPLIKAFEKQGFSNLQDHQEEAIRWLADDNHALISASTGRGKTEAWFIPLLQYALRAKQGNIPGRASNSIKAVLTYPTKALAQDQLKRFIEYLWIVNRKSGLADDEHLTIGVYDGDTPRRGGYTDGKKTHKYLEDSFEFFELPDTIAEELASNERVRETESPRLHVKKEGNEYFLKTRQSYGGEYLKFVHLTRDRMEENPPDILLTNPDTINYRLFNINDEQSHKLFVDQPKFLVFDEVHTYEGLFGAHVSSLVKRLRRLRQAREIDDPLRLIASSATVGQKEELFQRLFGVPHGDPYKIIEEDISIDTPSPQGTLPTYVKNGSIDASELQADINRWYNGEPIQTYSWISELGVSPRDCRSPDDVLRTAATSGTIPWLTHLHEVLRDPTEFDSITDAPRPTDFVDYIESTYDVGTGVAEMTAQNVLSLFEAGDFEVRVHMFNWPVDGYYKCLHCHSIYPSPQSCDCNESEGHSSFVTKIRLCNNCGEQLFEAWYCPDCADVRPLRQETEGEYLYANEPECTHENHGDLTRVYFTPEYECESCGQRTIPSESLGSCEICDGLLTRTENGIACKNPECSNTVTQTDPACGNCGGDIIAEDDLSLECDNPDCEKHGQDQFGTECSVCEERLIPRLVLPWVCTDEAHSERHNPHKLKSGCSCGRNTFVLSAYVDTQEADYCTECNANRNDVYYLPGSGCTKHDDDAIERIHKSFNLRAAYRDQDGNIRLQTPSTAKHALPCYHSHRDYDHLMRSPTNTGVTMSQFILRKLADENVDQSTGKLMSFADSYHDMERLANDFDEPEKLLFIQQQMLRYVEETDETTLADLIAETRDQARTYWNDLGASSDIIDDEIGFIEWTGTITGELLPGSYRLFNGDYGRTYGRMVSNGLLNIDLAETPDQYEHKQACAELFENNRVTRESLMETLREDRAVDNPTEVIADLRANNLIEVDNDSDRVQFNPEKILVRAVKPGQPIRYKPQKDKFISDAAARVKDYQKENFVDFDIPYTERTTLESPHFNRDAYWAATTKTRLLLSQVYKGDLKADERRRIEHEFKRNSVPNFLSTGPAMEIGIDIGDLNTLLLLGSPPNTNAYLQRIGRAGRSEAKSLVTTISKRNPIDFYYHKKPEKLISSEEKPIPLDQHNEHVLRSALTWAVMDYIAANYHIPWKREENIEASKITPPVPSEWNRFKKDSARSAAPSDHLTFNQVYHADVTETNKGQVLAVLEQVAQSDEGVRAWLEDLLDYAYCRNCGHIYDSAVSGTCKNCEEDAEVKVAKEEYKELIDEALSEFGERLVRFAYEYHNDLETEQEKLEKRRQELSEIIADSNQDTGFGDFTTDDDDEEVEEATRELETVRNEIQTVDELLSEYNEMSLSNVHERSLRSEYTPQLRAFGDSVAVTRYRRNPKTGKINEEQESSWDRNAAMALRELHPYAYNLKNKRGYVVTRVHEDTESTKELRAEIGTRLRCSNCGTEKEWNGQSACPSCGATGSDVDQVEPIALKRVELSDKERKIRNRRAEDIYPLSSYHTSPQNTFAHVTTRVSDFETEDSVILTDSDGTPVAELTHGSIEITETVDSFTTSYSDGDSDPKEQTLTLCGERHCNSVVSKNTDDDPVCLRDPEHNRSKQREVMVGRMFQTKGLQITSATPGSLTERQLHTLTHGFRLALQRIGGVEIRSLQESFDYEEGDEEAFIFESTVGGNGVTDLLYNVENGELVELTDALSVMKENFSECECSSGCPECIFQYGCDEDNKDYTFDKTGLLNLLDGLDPRHG